MAKSPKKAAPKKEAPKKPGLKKLGLKKPGPKKLAPKKAGRKAFAAVTPVSPPPPAEPRHRPPPPRAIGASAAVLDRLWGVVMSRRDAPVELSHSARLLSRGTAKVAQKFGEEAVECLIEAVAGNRDALVAESADVLYHLLVLWVDAGIAPEEVWAELQRREGVSGIAEKASRARRLPGALGVGTSKIP
jgi:phosphoribosyl-ATP pyrophosphohydrolase